jgi:hypothetical protein
MARLAVGVVGAAVGFYLGGPAGASIGWSLGAAAGGFLFPESGPNVEGARLDDLRVMGSSYGVPIPIVAGAMRVPGQVIWAANLREVRTEEDVGGKGGPSATQVSYRYTGTFAVALCEGQIAAVTRVWANGQCVYDVRDPGNTEALVASGNWVAVSGMRVYLGTEAQLPDPAIEAAQGVGTTPAFRGLAYVVFENLPLDAYGNALPRQLDFEVVTGATTDTPRRAWTPPVALAGSYSAPWIETFDGPVVAINNGSGITELRSALDGGALGPGTSSNPRPAADANRVAASRTSTGLGVYTRSGVVGSGYEGCVQVGADGINLLVPLIAGRCVRAVFLPTRGDWAVVVHASAPLPTLPDAWLLLDLVSGVALSSGTVAVTLSTDYFNGVGRASGADPAAWYYCAAADDADWRLLWLAQSAGESGVTCWRIGLDNVLRVHAYLSGVDLGPPEIQRGLVEGGEFISLAIAARDGLCAIAHYDKLWVYRAVVASTAAAPALQAVVAGLCARAGLSAGQIDVSLLTGTVDGVAYTRGGSGRSLLDSLRATYWFDAVESGDKIRFVPRGGAPVAALTLDDLAAADDGAAIASEREHDDALPERVAVAYAARDSDYRVGSQLAVRSSLAADALRTVELPLALSDARAAQAAQVALADAWMGRTARRLTLMPRWAALEPTDVIDLTDATRTARLRVVRKSEALAEGVRLECVDEDAALYAPTATAGTVTGTGNSPALGGPTRLEVLDLPPLRDADDNAGYYAALAGYTSAWPGGVLFDSADGVAFTQVAASGRGAVIGAALTALPDFAGGNVFDEASVLEVSVPPTVTLASVTRAQALGGANAALVGSEVLAFRTATLVSAGRYTLTGLLRGRVGTEWAQSGHAAGDRFVLLTTSLADVPADLAVVGSARTLKAGTVGTRVDDAVPRPFTPAGARLKPFAPAHLTASVTADGVRLRWRRSNRLGYAWRDYSDAPLSEATERYDLELLAAPGGAVVQSWSDLAATQQDVNWLELRTALGQIPSSLAVRGYQRSAAVGRGWPAERSLPLAGAVVTSRDWNDASTASQTLYGGAGKAMSAFFLGTASYALRLNTGVAADARARFDFAASASGFWAFVRVYLGVAATEAGLCYRTTYWGDANDTFGYFVGLSASAVYLGRGSNAAAGSYSTVSLVSRSQSLGEWYDLAIAAQGNRHRVWVNGAAVINTTDSTFLGAGQFAARAYGGGAGGGDALFDDLTIIT